jgi:Flp pilus assembly protein TadG
MRTMTAAKIVARLPGAVAGLARDRRGLAAVEFALIVPLMLVLFYGTLEFSSRVAVDRKVTLVARTLSDLMTRTVDSVADNDLKNFFAASASILTPYEVAPTEPTISEVYIDDKKVAKIQWSKSATIATVSGAPQATLKDSQRKKGDTVAVPGGLLVPDSYLIWSEVTYTYKPAIGYVMAKAGIPLKNQSYTRPRQSKCVDYPEPVLPALPCTPAP